MIQSDDDTKGNEGNQSNQCNQKSSKPHKFFKSAIRVDMLYDFIKKIAYKMPNSDYYLIDMNSYKKAMYCPEPHSASLVEQFCNDLMPSYCKEKQVFLTRKMSYNNLNTILRQVCRHCGIECKSERKYDKSKTHIVYHIASFPSVASFASDVKMD